tara:strand:+ start:9328 stop:9687 length:360 start_codon:yes stop_codon:yes gene_type:complete
MSDFLANFILVFLTALFLKSFFDSYSNPQKHFTLTEYVTLQPIGDKDAPQQTPAKPKPLKPKPETVKVIDEEERVLKTDCELALKKLGCDNKHSKYIIKMTFEKHSPKTVEEFLQKAFV